MTITQNGFLARDDNDNPVMGGTSSVDNATIINAAFNPSTRRLLTDASGSSGVQTISIATANGFAGSSDGDPTDPTLTLSTTVTGIVKGNGTALSAASAGTDYVAPGAITTSGLTMATARLLGRTTASTGAVEEITVGSGLTLSGGQLTANAASDNITVGTTTITSGTNTRVLYDNSGVLGEYVTTSAATASAVAIRDTNANIFFNNFLGNGTATVSAGGTTVLTAASSRFQLLTGSSAQTYQLPDATTLSLGPWFVFNNNSSQSLTITNAGGSTIYTVPAGGIVQAGPTSIASSNGSWDVHGYFPGTVTWSSGTSGLIFNTALTTSPQIQAGASSATAPSFIPQRTASTTGIGGDGSSIFTTIGGTAILGVGSGGLTITEAKDIILGTTTGTKIGTATTQKLGFYNATPVIQQTGDVATALSTLGLVATPTVNATTISTATESTDTTCFPVFVTASGTQTLPAKTNTTLTYNSNTNDLGVTKINGLTITASTGTFTLTNAKTLSVTNSLTLSGTDSTTMTFPSTNATIARTDAAQTFTGTQTFSQVITTANAITASGNAATIPVTSRHNIVTNNSAATLTITLTTSGAVNMQTVVVQILDATAAAQTITWVNTENSTVTAPTTSNGSTTLPLTVGFLYNSATSKWRCIASA